METAIKDHFVDTTEMVALGSGAKRPVKTILLSHGHTHFAIKTQYTEDHLSLNDLDFSAVGFDGIGQRTGAG